MKKKRSGKKKSNTQNKSNNNGTTAEVTFAPDKHHNNSRPCSALAASISKEIFPSLPSSNNDTDDISTGKLLLTQQPLFALMLLRHMIEERKKIRAGHVDDEHKDEHNTHETEPQTINTELDTLIDSYIDSNEALQILDNEAKRWGERDISSFVAFLTQNFDCHVKKMQQKKSDKQCALQDMLNADALELKDVLPTISIEDSSAHINSIDCCRCRVASTIQLRNITSGYAHVTLGDGIEIRTTKENTSIILSNEGVASSGSISKDNTTCAASSAFHLELRPISKDADKYWQVGAVLNDSSCGGGHGFDYPISTRDIINLTTHVILDMHAEDASGNHDNTEGYDLGDKELAKIALQVKKRLNETEVTFKAVKLKLYGIRNGLESIDPAPRSTFDMKTSKMLLGFDEQLELGFKQLGDLLLQIFKLTSFVGWSTTRGFKFLQFTLSLLERYNHALDTLIDPVQQYRGNLIRVADSGGQVTQIYKHRASRDGLQKLIEIKMNILGRLSQDMERAVTIGFQDGETSCMVEILVLQEYRRYADTTNQDGCSPQIKFSPTKLVKY